MARLALFDAGPQAFVEDLTASMRAQVQDETQQRRAGAVGVIQIRGTISQHARDDISTFLFGGSTVEAIVAQLREFNADETVNKIVLDIDSPGGSSYGLAELANEIYRSRGRKPILAVANSLAASAAYWIAASADSVYAAPGSLVGSIGVYTLHLDFSGANEQQGVIPSYISAGKFKVEGNEDEPLGDDARKHIQSIIDDTYQQFVRDVARGRGVSEATVRNGYGEGRVLTARQAKTVGMIDDIWTLEQAITRQATRPGQQPTEEQAAEAATIDDGEAEQEAEREAGAQRLGSLRLRLLKERAARVAVEV